MMNFHSMTTRWEFGHEVDPEKWKIDVWVTKHNAIANDDTYACVTPPRHERQWHDSCLRGTSQCAHLQTHPLSVVRILSFRLLCLHLHTHMHLGSSLSLSCHLHGHPCVCGLFTLILPFYFLLYLPPLFLFLNYMKSLVNLHNSCNESVDASDELLLSTKKKALRELSLFWGKKQTLKVVYLKTQIQWFLFCGELKNWDWTLRRDTPWNSRDALGTKLNSGKNKGNLEALSRKVNLMSGIFARLVLRHNHWRKPHDKKVVPAK